MKLIYKTTRYYLIYALFIFGLGTVLFYYVIKIILINSIDEAIHQEKLQLIENLNYENVIDELRPSENIEIRHSDLTHIVPDKYSIILVYDSAQKATVDYRQLKAVYEFEGKFYEIQIRQSMEEAEALLYGILPAEIALFLLFMVGVLVMNNFVNRNVWKPFYDLLEKIKEYDFEKTKVIQNVDSDIAEFKELGVSIEKMTTKIYKDFLSQKEFNENSSHELQTPLAIIRNKLELLVQSPNLGENDLEIIQSVFNAVKRLTLLNRGLILISKIDNQQYSGTESVNISSVLKTSIENFYYQIEENELHLTTLIENQVILSANFILIETLISNILSNAIRHNSKGGVLEITLNSDYLLIKNTGKPLLFKSEDMFERFKKSSDKEQSIGLGLSIVKKIGILMNFDVKYSNEGDFHSMKIIF